MDKRHHSSSLCILFTGLTIAVSPAWADCPGYETQSFSCNDPQCIGEAGLSCNQQAGGLICPNDKPTACLYHVGGPYGKK